MPLNLENQVALVTGAGRGIGRSIAHALAAAGARTQLIARSADELERTRDEILAAGGAAAAHSLDIADPEAVARVFERVRDEEGRLDVLINNAGVGAFGAITDVDTDELDRVLATNVRGTFACCQAALRIMREQGRGYVINIGSVVSFRGYPNQSAYVASKHAVHGLTKSLAVEARAFGVRVSAVLPGGVDTDLIGDARPDLDRSQLLQPDDVAETVTFLLGLPPRAAIDEIYIRRSGSAPF